MLVLACLPAEPKRAQTLLEMLAHSLQHVREVKVLIELSHTELTCGGDNDVNIDALLQHSFQLSMLNVVLICSSFVKTLLYYGYEGYPKFKLQVRQFQPYKETTSIYPDKLLNMHHHPIYSMPDQAEPYTIVYEHQGKVRVIGMLWYILEEFAHYHNATLRWLERPIPGNPPNQVLLGDLIRNGSLDITASASFLDWGSYYYMTYPMAVSSWCIMTPLERHVSARDAIIKAFKLESYIMLLGFYALYVGLPPIMMCIRRQRSWPLDNVASSFYRLIALCLAIQLLAFYEARVQTFLIHPLRQNHITTFNDLESSQVRIWSYRYEFYRYDFELRIKFGTVFRLTDLGSELVKMRNALNTSYAYTITSNKWPMCDGLQRGFRRPLFHYSNDVCIQSLCLFAMMIRNNSVFYDRFNHFLTKLRQAGFISHWIKNSFFDMV
ncbi:uncharacterized protein LOC115625396 [Scaptodrosophila lebanonensis]|uniref:Uncharacterized protein LOC115625396 n=1 Tax=Drosophila lebanonensis TaxID=7225 RepID=A0A6J2TLA0_DROLE|nr:uncharacterized protein LOC115625396 [Scaptodrosophila lebanonensis]